MSTPEALRPGVSPDELGADAVIDRLKLAMKVRSDVELAAALGLNKSTVSTWRSRGRVPYAEAVKEGVERGVNIDWILTGRGSESLMSDQTAEGIQLDILAAVLYRIWDRAPLNAAEHYGDFWGKAFYRALVIQREYEAELSRVAPHDGPGGAEARARYMKAMLRSKGIDPDKDPF